MRVIELPPSRIRLVRRWPLAMLVLTVFAAAVVLAIAIELLVGPL